MKKLLLFSLLINVTFCTYAQVSDNATGIANKLLQKNIAAAGLKPADLGNSIVTGTYLVPGSNIRMVYLQQTYQDIPVYNQVQVLAFNGDKLVSNAGGRLPAVEQLNKNAARSATISSANAVQASLALLKIKPSQDIVALRSPGNGKKFEFGKQNISIENITAELIWLPVDDGKELKLVWQVFVAPHNDQDYWLVRIDATNNSFINKQSLTIKCNWDTEDHSEKGHLNNNNGLSTGPGSKPLVSPGNNKSGAGAQVVNTATYRVIKYPAESPQHSGGASVLVTAPWNMSPGNATTLGWHNDGTTSYSNTRGNNVYAYEDRNADNLTGVSPVSTTAQPSLTFNFVPDFTLAPTVTSPTPNQQFNTTNLFYWNNLMHDLSYIYGFNEASRNFQNNNQSRGGAGADYVLAESQDGSGTNNANFSTPADGGRGRMQMYLWTAPTPDRDGDVDNGIIAHEYTHGISNRLTGNGSTCLTNAEQMGEGWSDFFGLMITQDWSTTALNDGFSKPRGIGTYALNQPITGLGIRQYRYTTDMSVNPLTYGNLASVVAPHGVGTIWCTALWDMTWEIIQQNGTINPNIFNIGVGGGNAIALKLVLEGLRLQPCSPGFIDGRNAILKADTLFFGAQYSCAIIKAFARRGMGLGASQGSSNSRTDQTLSFVDCSSATCNTPTGLTATNITTTSAAVNWSAVSGATNYTVEYKLNTASAWITAAAATTATTASISGLTAASLYDWRVRTNCSSGSGAFTAAQFTTSATANCSAPTGLTTSAITTSSATVNWATVPGALNYTVEYKLNTAATWTVAATAITATSFNITGLTAGSAYNCRVLATCPAGNSAYTQVNFTTTSLGCASSYDISSNGTTGGAAQIPLNTDVTGLISPTGDNDYYKFVITTSGTATITLSTLPADYDIRLYRSNGTSQLAISQNGNTTSETISGNFGAGTYYLKVYGYNGANNANTCYTLKVATGTASFGEELLPGVITRTRVFPNPANKSVTVSMSDFKSTADLLLYDIYGKLLLKQRARKSDTQVDISNLPSGTYIIRVKNNGKETNLKIVKQ
ncbi:MAG: M36 family metallopeptidase [Ferruginibacter sp.]